MKKAKYNSILIETVNLFGTAMEYSENSETSAPKAHEPLAHLRTLWFIS